MSSGKTTRTKRKLVMGIELLVDVSLQLTLNIDSIAQVLNNVTGKGFMYVCFGVTILIGAFKKKSV